MGAKVVEIGLPSGKSGKIQKWKVKEGSVVSAGRVILLYDVDLDNGKVEQRKLRATEVGTVRKLLVREGEIVRPGDALLEIEECTHPTVMKDMCAECGADLRKEDQPKQNASVPMVHSIPELKVSKEEAEILGRADEHRLLKDRKLVLLVDLDQTLIHTTNDNIPANLKDVYHFQLYGPNSPWYHTRLRPGTHHFLNEMSELYELHICTFGARNYAHMIAMFLDPEGKYFSHRILSRDECFNSNSKTANLKALFPCGDNMVCIIDDREDVWNFAPNLVHVKPYHFFQHTGDINAPPGLAKCENDEKEGFDFTKMADSKELCDKNDDVKENGERRTSDGVCVKRTESEKEDGEVSEDSRIGSGETVSSQEDSKLKRPDSEKVHEENTSVCSDKPSREALVTVSDDLQLTEDESQQSISGPKTAVHVEKDVKCEEVEVKCEEVEVRTVEKAATKVSTEEEEESESESKEKMAETEETCDVEKKSESGEDNLIEVEDKDDYLLYLEEILRTIHKAFYQLYDELHGSVPDLKTVIPYVRRKVLAGTSLVFSGLVPTHIPLEKSRVYQVAKSLGAQVTQDFTPKTTHLVAVRPGTAKVNAARRLCRTVITVNADWLWCCAERWERVDERLYPLLRGGAANRHPPAHCGSPEHIPSNLQSAPNPQQPAARKRTPSGRFMDTINPLMSFSSADIADMDREVEDIFNESESEGETEKSKITKKKTGDSEQTRLPETVDESSSSSADSLSGEHPHGWCNRPQKRKRAAAGTATESDQEEEDDDDDTPSVKFRRGEELPSDLDLGDEESIGSDDPPDEVDDGEWNMMGAALEREFLSGDN